ncbi:MAG: hypothetical protein JSV01_02425 [Desulfobacterales bacterium]|nr:MAG: hypothetical protein JSV01_02425 [Desulfobacterales bacterium]
MSNYSQTGYVGFLSVRVRTLIFFSATLLFTGNCAQISRFVGSAVSYHTETYKTVCDEWSREARIHRGLEVELIVSATFKSEEFRRAYAEEYAKAYRLTPEKKKQFVDDQLEAATRGHEFLMAAFVPEEKWDDFDQPNSVWKLYLVNDQNERVEPVEVRSVRRQDAVTPHFFPYVTPWKSVYKVRFPYNIPTTDQPIIEENTKEIKLVITSLLGTAELGWKLE